MTVNEHPDLETLSAHLDGEVPAVEAHVRACAACQQDLAALADVRAAVAAPVAAPGDAERDRAVAAAVAGRTAPVAARRDRPFLGRWVTAGVAAAVAAGVIVAVVVHPGTSQKKASFRAAGQAVGPSTATVDGGDLGELPDAAALRSRVEPSLRLPTSTAGTNPGDTTGRTAPGSPVLGARKAAPASAHCEAAARALQPGTQRLVYAATARWQGTPAEVFGFSPAPTPTTAAAGRPAPVRVYVMALRGCRLLVFQSYAP
jgi:hypothetical protein